MAYEVPGTVVAGDVVTASSLNVLANDIIQIASMARGVFTNEAARDAAITAPTEGMIVYLTAPTIPAATGATTALPTGVRTIYNGSVWVCVTPVGANTLATGTTTSGTYTATLSGSPGTNPSVSVVTGTTALVSIAVDIVSAAGQASYATVAISGATTLAASDTNRVRASEQASSAIGVVSARSFIFTGLTAGTNTFTLQYATTGGSTGNFSNRSIFVQGVA